MNRSAQRTKRWLAARQRLAAWLLCLLACSGSALAADIDRERLNGVLGSILKVEAVNESGHFSLGTAVAVAAGKFITSCHVTAQASQIALLFDGVRWPVVAQLSDIRYDLCVLDAPGLKDVTPVPLRSARELHVGQTVAALGYTFGAGLLAQAGAIRALHALNGSSVIQSATPFSSGASGGGLFDENGSLVGILTFRLPGAPGFYFSMPIDWVKSRIALADSYQPVAPLTGARPFWAQPNELLPFFMQATTLEAAGSWQELIKLTEQWADDDQQNAEPWFVRGQAYGRLDRNDAAVKSYKAALALDPQLAPAWFNLGEAYFRRGDHAEVRRVMTELKRLDPDLADDFAVKTGIAR